MVKEIDLTAGHCSSITEAEVRSMAYTIGQIRPIAKRYGINAKLRDGPYKPRTELRNGGKRNFEGVGPDGLKWMGRAANDFKVPVAAEIMSQTDLRYFFGNLDVRRDMIWAGARDSQGYGLLAFMGLTPFSAMVKNPMQGTLPNEAKGSLERFTEPTEDENILREYRRLVGEYETAFMKNPDKVLAYCIRGQSWPIGPDGRIAMNEKERLLKKPYQHSGSRNVNNIETIHALREHPFFQEHGIKIVYDPSHVFGGTPNGSGVSANHLKRLIGEYAIKAITEFGFDALLIEVHDTSGDAKTDKDQALVTTYAGIDYARTNMVEEPTPHEKPLSLVDIVKALIMDRVARKMTDVTPQQLSMDMAALDNIRWNMSP